MNADGQAHGQFQKNLGIFPIMVVAPSSQTVPTFIEGYSEP